MPHTWFEVFVLAVQMFLVDAFPGVVQALLFVFFFDMPHVWFVFAVQPFLVGFGILARNLSSRCFGVSFRCLTQSLTLVLVHVFAISVSRNSKLATSKHVISKRMRMSKIHQ